MPESGNVKNVRILIRACGGDGNFDHTPYSIQHVDENVIKFKPYERPGLFWTNQTTDVTLRKCDILEMAYAIERGDL